MLLIFQLRVTALARRSSTSAGLPPPAKRSATTSWPRWKSLIIAALS